MVSLPIKGKSYPYTGKDPQRSKKMLENTLESRRVAEYVNQVIANNPSELQQIFFREIAADIDADIKIVAKTLGSASDHGITFRVTEADRRALRPYVTATSTTSNEC